MTGAKYEPNHRQVDQRRQRRHRLWFRKRKGMPKHTHKHTKRHGLHLPVHCCSHSIVESECNRETKNPPICCHLFRLQAVPYKVWPVCVSQSQTADRVLCADRSAPALLLQMQIVPGCFCLSPKMETSRANTASNAFPLSPLRSSLQSPRQSAISSSHECV